MPHYKVVYTLDEMNNYVYPENVKDVVWKTLVYHNADKTMVGETDTVLETDGERVVLLTETQADELVKQYGANFPQEKERPA